MCHFKDDNPTFDGIEITDDIYPRECSICGTLMWEGFVDGDAPGMWYACEGCMDNLIQDGYARLSKCSEENGDENSAGGFYDFKDECGEWVPCDVFYTEWWY